ncbi:hypothetical protein HYZ64_03030 [Candidatus Berkelbacteria bacterium]|nr:hypothetical protein [Candidatus Berkelbacteria bacterium]
MIFFQVIVGQPQNFTFTDLIATSNRIIDLIIVFAVGSSVIAILWAAYIYISSFGSEERAKQAKNIWYFTLIGLAVMLLAKVIIATALRVIEPGKELRENIDRVLKSNGGNTAPPQLEFKE